MITDSPHSGATGEVFSEDWWRAGAYALLANLLGAPPKDEMLARLTRIESGDGTTQQNGMAAAWNELKNAAEQAEAEQVDDEYHDLFIGIGRGELVPYGSWYLTGFLMEKPLAELRRDLARLGYEREQGVHEPEDHAAALCEVMAMLITDASVPSSVQRQFFETHVGSWIDKFFKDLESATSARFYRAVGRLGRELIKLEKQYLSMLV